MDPHEHTSAETEDPSRHGDRAVEQIANAEESLDEQIPVSPGGTLYVDLDRGAVEVTSHDRDEVHVEALARGWSAGMVLFTLERSGSDVQLDGSVDHWMPSLLGGPRVQVRCRVPRDYSVEIETHGGRIRVEEVRGRVFATTRGSRVEVRRIEGPALLRTSGGSVRVDELKGDLRVKTSGGRIKIRRVDGDVEARTSAGSIEIDDVTGQVDARTSGGSIQARFVHEPWGRLETSGGSIQVTGKRGSGFDLDARTSGGTVEIDPPLDEGGRVTRTEAEGKVLGGGAPLSLRTSGGSIQVRVE